ncbi:MAG TPA: hypothetical protein VKZ53_06095 [Candidatus Angelobacter sp.]|nr:hypothetical protein [Candidatus Angelobacter sp.]
MKGKLLVLSLGLNLLFVIVACNSFHNSGSAKNRSFVGPVPGFHGLSGKQTTAFDLSLTPKLHAQAMTTVSFTGSFAGFCPSINAPAGTASLLYGSGSLNASDCSNISFTGNANNSQTAAANASGAQLVVGNGTIGPLVAYADSSSATVHVWVNRAGQTLDTSITATLTGKRGQSTATFPVMDGDTIAVVAENNGTSSTNLQFVLAKQ